MAEADRPISVNDADLTLGEIDAPAETEPKRRRGRIIMISVPLLIAATGAYFWLTSGRYVGTDNAYLKQDVVAISPEVSGKIVAVNVRENQVVRAGDILFRIDAGNYEAALHQADASVANAQLEVQKLQTDYGTTGVDIDAARDAVRFAQEDYNRQAELMRRGFTTRARLEQAENALQQAKGRLGNAQGEAAKARAALGSGGTTGGVNPMVATARAQQEKAALDYGRTLLRAPVSGRATQTAKLQVGNFAFSGMSSLSIVANDRSWIEANFKETQLNKMRPGLPATIKFDAYPGLELKGHVESIGAGTGSQFSVLPAQNATGNWIKVTQRVPVRIAIDDKSPRPLIAGLSAKVEVDTGSRSN